MASARLSSSRNCENSGANLTVSFCALRRFHHFPMETESDQTDMKRSTAQRNFPKKGVCAQMLAKSRFITQLHHGWGKGDYLVIAKENGCCTSWRTFLSPTSAGMNRMRGSAFFTAVAKSSCVVRMTLNEAGSARPVVSTTKDTRASPSTPA